MEDLALIVITSAIETTTVEASLARLSQRDVELLAADPNPANRQNAMLRVAELYTTEPLNPTERQIAVAIVQSVLPEAELEIRRRLSEAPRDRAVKPRAQSACR